jgi:hypothetical protein
MIRVRRPGRKLADQLEQKEPDPHLVGESNAQYSQSTSRKSFGFNSSSRRA